MKIDSFDFDERESLSIIDAIQCRQKQILKNLPKFTKITVISSFVGFIITFIIQIITGNISQETLGLITLKNPTLGSIISLVLSFFSVILLWIFVIWSIFFIPYIAYRAHKISTIEELPVETKTFRWLQLFSSTFLPMIIFAVAWNSINNPQFIIVNIDNIVDVGLVLVGSSIIWGLLWLITNKIPTEHIAIQISFISLLLYISLFISYGFGFGLISYSTLFGILFFIAFGFNKIEDIGREISTYDIDPDIAKDINDTTKDYNKAKIDEDRLKIKEMKMKTSEIKEEQQRKIDNINNKKKTNEHFTKLRKNKLDFDSQVNEITLNVFNKKSYLLNEMFKILSTELDERIETHIPQKIKELRDNAKNFSQKELQEKMDDVYKEMNDTLSDIPDRLQDLRIQMDETVKQIIDTTKQIYKSENEFIE